MADRQARIAKLEQLFTRFDADGSGEIDLKARVCAISISYRGEPCVPGRPQSMLGCAPRC